MPMPFYKVKTVERETLKSCEKFKICWTNMNNVYLTQGEKITTLDWMTEAVLFLLMSKNYRELQKKPL